MKKIFTKSENFKQEYCTSIVKIGPVLDIPNYDSIGVTTVDNFTMVVRKDECKEGDILFYAANESELNADFLSKNNLFEIGSYELNENANEVKKLIEEGKSDEARKLVGFFNKYGRVKMIRLGGTPSFGFLFHKETVEKWDPSLKKINLEDYIGEEFDTINGVLFSKPYVPRIKVQEPHEHKSKHSKLHNKMLKKIERIVPGEFAYHYDTQTLERNVKKLNPTDIVDISVKCDGTSFIMGNVKVRQPIVPKTKISWLNDIIVRLYTHLPKSWQKYDEHYEDVYSSRNKIRSGNEFYSGKVEINPDKNNLDVNYPTGLDSVFPQYGKILKDKIPSGITIYGEIVGYVPGTSIGIISRGGKVYDYGCKIGENKLMIYRVTEMDKNGSVREYEISEVIKFQKDLIAKYPEIADNMFELPLLYHGMLMYLYPISIKEHWHENLVREMKRDKDRFGMECKEKLCKNSVWREGVVIRVENDPIKEAYKLKCVKYLNQESEDISKGIVNDDMLEGYATE